MTPANPATGQPASDHPATGQPASDHPACGRSASRVAWYAWAVPGLLMAAVGSVGIGRPGLWGDEFATWGVARLPWAQVGKMLRHTDAVIGPYYAFMSAWTRVFGASDVSLRVPSLLAMSGATALIGVIGARLGGTRAGLVSGVLFAVLPSVSRHAQEVRAYAFVVFAAVLATYLLVRVSERPRPARLVGYGLAVALLGLCHLVALLLLVAHGAVICSLRHPRVISRWLVAAALGALPTAPLAWLGWSQRQQVAWLGGFHQSPLMYFETLGGSLVGAVIFVVLAVLSRPLRQPASWYAAWAALPLAALLAISAFIQLMLPRYLLFTLPAWALLAGTALARWRVGWSIAAVVTLAVLTVPAQLSIRGRAGHENTASRDMVAAITGRYQPGDAIAYAVGDGDTACCEWVARDALLHYAPADRRPRDAFLRRPQRAEGVLAATECEDLDACLGHPPRVWIVRLRYHDDPVSGLGIGKEELIRRRYRQIEVWHLPNFTVALLAAR